MWQTLKGLACDETTGLTTIDDGASKKRVRCFINFTFLKKREDVRDDRSTVKKCEDGNDSSIALKISEILFTQRMDTILQQYDEEIAHLFNELSVEIARDHN